MPDLEKLLPLSDCFVRAEGGAPQRQPRTVEAIRSVLRRLLREVSDFWYMLRGGSPQRNPNRGEEA